MHKSMKVFGYFRKWAQQWLNTNHTFLQMLPEEIKQILPQDIGAVGTLRVVTPKHVATQAKPKSAILPVHDEKES